MQRNMKIKYESPWCKTLKLKYTHHLLAGSETEPETEHSGEGTIDD